MQILDSENVLFDYKEDDFGKFTENVFLFNTGSYPVLKLQLMKSIYLGNLFCDRNCDSFTPEVELEMEINLISSSNLMFMFSCCYLPSWIVDIIYFVMKVNDHMTNLQIKEWKQER